MYFHAYEAHEMFKITKFYTLCEHLFPGGFEFQGESHGFWECVYVKDGSVTICAGERIYMLKKGDIIFHKPLEFHKYKVEEDSFANLFTCAFSLEGENIGFFENQVFKLSKKQQRIVLRLLSFLYEKSNFYGIVADRVSIYQPLRYRMQEFHPLLLHKKGKLYTAIILNCVYSLLLSIYDCPITIEEVNIAHADLYKKAIHYMSTHIGTKLTIEDIAKECIASTTSLKNTFLEFSGIGVHKYFLKLKLSQSIVLLSQGCSVNDIAQMLGFSSQAYFSAAFKREMGCSPTKYLKK